MINEMLDLPSIEKPWLKFYHNIESDCLLPPLTAYEFIYHNNKNNLDNIALNYYGNKVTYKELFSKIDAISKAFYNIGVRAGDIVIICSINTPETIYAIYALNRLGAIANMIDPRTNESTIIEYINETESKFILTIESVYPIISKATKMTKVKKIICVSPSDSLPHLKKVLYNLKNKTNQYDEITVEWKNFIKNDQNDDIEYYPYKKDNCWLIVHTGGTTGAPKGVMISNDNINAVAIEYKHTSIPFERGDKYFNDLPPFIIYGLTLAVHTVLTHGLEMILYPVFDSKNFPKVFAKYKPNHFSTVPEHLKNFIGSKYIENMDLSFLISVGVGGDTLDEKLERSVNTFLRKHGCKYKVQKGYGMTETTATAILTFGDANAIGSVGVPMIKNNVKIINLDTKKEMSYNEIGEIYISAPSIMLGYYKKHNETSKIILFDEEGNRWIKTGDLGYLNKDGLLFHKGRIRRIYITEYEGQPAKIFPNLIEQCIMNEGFVKSCVAIGRQKNNSSFYEIVVFVVKVENNMLEKDIIARLKLICKTNLPSYMVPVDYKLIDKMPLTKVGKVNFVELENRIK